MSRRLTSHQVGSNELNASLEILVMDEPGAGGAHHYYKCRGYGGPSDCEVHFQCGPVKDAGVNGISNEALLAIVEDRLKCFQAGDYACRENALALTHLQEAMHWLHHRTRDRIARKVEGTNQK